MLDDPQFDDPDVLALWIRLMLMASYKDKNFKHYNQKVNLKRGQFITGRKSLSESSGVQESKVQRVLKRWQNEQQIEQQTFSKYRLISIVNYDKYQTSEQQTDGKVNTINKFNKSNKNNKAFEKPSVSDLANYFIKRKLTDSQQKISPEVAKAEAMGFLEYYENVEWKVGKNKKPMANWKTAASGWDKRRREREDAKQNGSQDIDFESKNWS